MNFTAILKSIWRVLFWQILHPLKRLLDRCVQSLKYLVAYLLSLLPISSEILGPPKGSCKSTRDWLESSSSLKIKADFKEIFPASRIELSKPGSIDRDLHWEFSDYADGFEFPSTSMTIIPHGRLWSGKSENFAVITGDDIILADVSSEYKSPNLLENHICLAQIKLPHVHKIDGTVAVLSSAGGTKYYFHWMADVLPRLHLLEGSGVNLLAIDKFIVNSLQEPYQKETLSDLGIPLDKFIESSKYPHIKADKLLVPSIPSYDCLPPLWVCNFLKDEFLHSDIAERSPQPTKIYISRSDANWRRLTNETELIEILLPLGFSVFSLSSLTVQEKASLFATAEVIIGPHSSGLTNLAFCRPGTKVIEIFSPLAVAKAFWLIASQRGLDYYYLLGEGEILPKNNKWGKSLMHVDISVNIDAFIQLLSLAGLT
jgi:capsular polysaccharide biosynthesis protein